MRGFWLRMGVCAALILAWLSTSIADTPAQTTPPTAKSWNSILFSSADVASHKQVFTQGLKWAPAGGLDASGFRALLVGSASLTSLAGNSLAGPNLAVYESAERENKSTSYALVGLEQLANWGAFGLYMGPQLSTQSVSAQGRTLTSTTRTGLRIQAEWWLHPAPAMLLTFKTAVSSSDRDVWAATSLGWQLASLQSTAAPTDAPSLPSRFAAAYLGPEAEISATGNYAKTRLGLHLTGVELLGFNTRISSGVQREGHRKAGAYVTFGVHWRK
jgi:Cellulose biosynthesis protein BcsS